MLCLLLPAWFSMNSWIFQPIQVGVAGLTPPGMRGTFYDGESSFPSGINKSPLAFGTFIWASKSHFISHQLQLLPPAQHSCFSLESWVPQRMELLLSLSFREWCGQKFPFPVGNKQGMRWMSPVLAPFVVHHLRNLQKKSSLFPHRDAKLQIYRCFCGFIGFSLGWLGIACISCIFGNAGGVSSKAGGFRSSSLEEQNSLKSPSLQPERNYFYFGDSL